MCEAEYSVANVLYLRAVLARVMNFDIVKLVIKLFLCKRADIISCNRTITTGLVTSIIVNVIDICLF